MRVLPLVLVSCLSSIGCALATDLSSLRAASGDAGDSGAAAADGAIETSTADVAIDSSPTCVDTTSDPHDCGACGHDCLGGACTQSVCQPVTLVSGQKSVGQLAVNGNDVLWVRSKGATQTGGLFAMARDGSNPRTLFESSAYACTTLATDGSTAYAGCSDGVIRQCSINACSPAPLAYATNVRALALDAMNAELYVAIGTPYGQHAGGYIGRVSTYGGSIARVTTNDQPNPGSMVLSSAYVYWVDSGTYTNNVFDLNGGVRRAPLALGQSETVLDNDTSGSDYFGLALDAKTAYYGAGASHEVHSVALLGGSASNFATDVGASSEAMSVASDDAYVYWSETSPTGGVVRCDKSCIKPEQLVSDPDAVALTQDATAIYWVSGTGEIKRLAK